MKKKSKVPTSKEFKSSIPAKINGGIFLFTGEEESEKETFRKILSKRFFDGDVNSKIFYADSDNLYDAASFILSQDMFSPQKLCVIKHVEYFFKKKENTTLFNQIVDEITRDTLLILETATNRVPAAINKSSKEITAVQFWKKFESELGPYIKEKLQDEGKTIQPDALQLLLELTGRKIEKINDALKNIIFGTEEKVITRPEVERVTKDTNETSIFDFIDALFAGKKEILKLLAKVLDGDTHELVIISMIFTRLKQIETYQRLRQQGESSQQVLNIIGLQKRQHMIFEQSARRFTLPHISDLFISLQRTEKLIKSSGYSKNILANPLIDLIYTIMVTSEKK